MNQDVKVTDLKRGYDENFVPSQEYLDSISDERDIIMAKMSLAKALNKLEVKSKYGKQ